MKLRHVLSCSRTEPYLTSALLCNYFYKTQRNMLMLLQGNQRGFFHLHIPVVHLLVVVLRNLQAPAEITRTLIIMTLQFSAALHYSLAHLVLEIYKNTLISGVPRITKHFCTQKEMRQTHNVSKLMALGYIAFLRLYFWEFFIYFRVILRQCDCCKHYHTNWMLILAETLSSQSLCQCLGKQRR